MALKSDGTLWTWGQNTYGQLGDGETTIRPLPAKVGADTDWSAISAGYYHAHALKSDGTLWTWGYNRFGQIMDSGGVPTYLTAERAMVCLNEFIRYRLVKERGLMGEWLR